METKSIAPGRFATDDGKIIINKVIHSMSEFNKIKFVTFFPQCLDVHITKDVGMIPFILHRDYSYDAEILSYQNDTYPKLISETPGLKIEFLRKYRHVWIDSIFKILHAEVTPGTIIDSFIFLSKYAKKIDIFQVYHFSFESLIVSLIFRFFKKKGKLYLKLDMKPDIIDHYKKKLPDSRIKFIFYRLLLKFISFDIISVETRTLNNFLKTEHPIFRYFHEKIYYIPGGINMDQEIEDIGDILRKKENLILHIGRLSFDKGTDIALETFIRIADQFPEWKLVLIGNMDDSFNTYFKQIISQNPAEAKKIERIGFIRSAQELKTWYEKGKILLAPSHSESFGIVTIESGMNGCVVVGSDIIPFHEITNSGSYGYLCPAGDLDCFRRTLAYVLSHKNDLIHKALKFRNHILINYNWSEICRELNKVLVSDE